MSDPIVRQLPVGRPSADPIGLPEVDEEGEFVLEPDEEVLHSDSHHVIIAVQDFAGGKERWQPTVGATVKARVEVTSSRVLVGWPTWNEDPSKASLTRRLIIAPALERFEGRRLRGGHIRSQWVRDLVVTAPDERQLSELHVFVQHDAAVYALSIQGLSHIEAVLLTEEFLQHVARSRLAHVDDSDDRAALRQLADGNAAPTATPAGIRYTIPGWRPFGVLERPALDGDPGDDASSATRPLALGRESILLNGANATVQLFGGDRLAKLLEMQLSLVSDRLMPLLSSSDRAGLILPATLPRDGVDYDGVVVALADRAVLAWTRGTIPPVTYTDVVPYRSIDEVEPDVRPRRRMTAELPMLHIYADHYHLVVLPNVFRDGHAVVRHLAGVLTGAVTFTFDG